ncbi:hypothetical protein LCGC14_3004750 [marine sediment metagenome]|uniref:Uncharacterized protein n=1 Tax=marine sediment metagenome TaxID=412755 RepID=A0A0F8ZR60_9ZZZZ
MANSYTISIVVESYSHNCHQIVIANSPIGSHHNYFFFYFPPHPDINFGDILLMDSGQDNFKVHYGNPLLTYKISPQPFPATLLLELISERLNQ